MHSRLLATLAKALGSEQAVHELRWMSQTVAAAASTTSLDEMVRRRSLGEPLQYILGTQPFGPLNLLTRPPVLIPRPETEHWVMKLAETISPSLQRPLRLLDLGTGSGCIPLLLCHVWPAGSLKAHAVDISPHALRLANENAALAGIPPASDSSSPQNTFTASYANFLSNDFPGSPELEKALPIDILTSNPPYIPWEEYLELPPSVTDYEDPKALFGGPSGLDFYHAIVRLMCRRELFNPNAFVALEVGPSASRDGPSASTKYWSSRSIGHLG
ncbi:S-adenosyl-L-methionine-dependent methyltransferase [Ephemerocybe angulata]|uniref:S-adenosyl-L-methionine-dependent methyltransferase n=1 Tax=Ephemerocybe angulata TaxID=980116 RepID=A0A8H6MBH9_9AGAR|nr:S-adenosyl-L-methionine-dependent methyltransferase [Tulosesus angulatus]